MCGELNVSADDVIERLHFFGYNTESTTPNWLRAWLRAADSSTLLAFLQFITGSAALSAYSLSRTLTVQRVGDARRLPVAHTCGWQLDLPEYESEGQLGDKLCMAVMEHSFGLR